MGSNTTDEDSDKTSIAELSKELGELQRALIDKAIPVAIVIEGVDAAGKGTLINRLLLSLDPRSYNVFSTHTPDKEAQYRPFLWRFWKKTPARGEITIYDRSWYRYILHDRVEDTLSNKQLPVAIEDITNFERQLTDDGFAVIKIFLSISQKEQKSRFEKLEANASTSWRVTKKDWKHHEQYDAYHEAAEVMFEKTSNDNAPWHIVKAQDTKSAALDTLKIVTSSIKAAIHRKKVTQKSKRTPKLNWIKDRPDVFSKIDLSKKLGVVDYRKKRSKLQQRLRDLEHAMHLKRMPVILAFEGWDAGGKGGAIRRLVKWMDPRGYEVIPVAAPDKRELSHHYLWRFWNTFPKGGHMGIYDRTWYGRVMVERLEGFCTKDEWQRAYQEINEMEKHWANHGAIILKFWLQIDKEEQLKRFESRQKIPHKQWKITDEDWRNRDKWNDYQIVVEDMIHLTNKKHAPWTIVEGNNKPYARVKVLETVVSALEAKL